jgi:hypothetical protein
MASLPAAHITGQDALGDTIVGPGCPVVLVGGLPGSVMGDAVAGSACVGAVVMGCPTVLYGGVPASFTTAPIVGVNPESGVPVATVVIPSVPTVLLP